MESPELAVCYAITSGVQWTWHTSFSILWLGCGKCLGQHNLQLSSPSSVSGLSSMGQKGSWRFVLHECVCVHMHNSTKLNSPCIPPQIHTKRYWCCDRVWIEVVTRKYCGISVTFCYDILGGRRAGKSERKWILRGALLKNTLRP